MRKCRNWVLTLALMASPGVTLAGPFKPFGDGGASSARVTNQQVADGIGAALRKANFQGSDIEVEFRGGVATLSGKVSDPRQKDLATQVVRSVDGVKSVDNRLEVQGAPRQNPFARGVRPANYQPTPGGVEQVGLNLPKSAPAMPPESPARPPAAAKGPQGPSPQEVADQIAASLVDAGLSGQAIDIRYEQGKALLVGSVDSPAVKARAAQVAQSVPGVKAVDNRLAVAEKREAAVQYPERQAQPRSPYMPANYQPQAGQPGVAPPMPGGALPPGAGGMPPAGPAVPGYPPGPAYGAMGGGAAMYDNPYLPQNSWPTYAPYPNSAMVNYPQQYSASAWPYIGPFYPYPQVPLGWRSATLEWDDGSWNLNFQNRTDKWWWFLNPKNWSGN